METDQEKTVKIDLESILKSLEDAADNDNRKFAILLILCELIKSNKLSEEIKTDRKLNIRLFNSIDAHFLARLLCTKQAPPSENCHPFIYKSVCLSILTQFLDYPKLIQDPVLVTKLDCFYEILKTPLDDGFGAEFVLNLKLDTFKYLYQLSKSDAAEYLACNGIIDLLFEHVILNEKCGEQKFRLIVDYDAADELHNLALIACKLIVNLFECKQAHASGGLKQFDDKFRQLVELAVGRRDEFKFTLVNYLNYFLQQKCLVTFVEKNQKLNDFVSAKTYELLNDLFRNKLNRPATELTFYLLKNFVNIYQFEYIYLKERNFFYLIIHLLCRQINLNLEMYDNATSSLPIISVYYSLLEEIIIILSTASPFDDNNDDDDDEMDEDDSENDEEDYGDEEDDLEQKMEQKATKKKTTKPEDADNEPEFDKAIQIVVELLQSLLQFLKDQFDEKENNLASLSSVETLLMISSIRLLMCWLSHESLLEKEINDLAPRMIRFADYVLTRPELDVNLYEFLAAGLQKILLGLNSKLDGKLKKSASFVDNVKFEYEKQELNEQVDGLKLMLDQCYAHMDKK